jgi:hypothetical protein
MAVMNAVAGAILVAFGLFLVSLTVVVFAKPAVAERFFMSFASSARAHYTEQVVRLLIGASLIIRSAAMRQPKVFWLVGCAIVLSSLALILAPWQWHRRFGEKVRPILIRRMKLFAIGILAFGVLLLYGLFSAVPPHAAYIVGEKSPLHSLSGNRPPEQLSATTNAAGLYGILVLYLWCDTPASGVRLMPS